MVQLTRRGFLLRSRREERGAVAIVVALLMIALIGCAALVVDLGLARDARREAQNASDAAALAAGNRVVAGGSWTAAIADAKAYAEKNFMTPSTAWSTCTDASHLPYIAPGTQCISTD